MPDSKVLVDEADLRAVAEWFRMHDTYLDGPHAAPTYRATCALGALVAALPEPEWDL